MATLAGQMQTGTPANPQWVSCNRGVYYVLDPKQPQRTRGVLSEGNRQDYIRQVGWQGIRRGLGPLGWIIQVPQNATYKVSLADDSSETGLVANISTTTTAIVASGATVIPVTSATGMAAGMPIAGSGTAPNSAIVSIAALNVTIAPATLSSMASGATITVTPPGPPTVGTPPAGTTA